jgi:hypothetical protein
MPSTSLAHDSQPGSAGQEDIARGRHHRDEDRYLNKTWQKNESHLDSQAPCDPGVRIRHVIIILILCKDAWL